MKQDVNELETYEKFLRRQKYAENTIKIYLIYAGEIEGEDATQGLINDFVERHNHPLARAFLKSFLRDYLEVNDLDIPKIKGRIKREQPKYIRYKEYLELIQDSGIRFDVMVLIRVLFETGLRINEAITINPDNIDYENKEIRGIGKGNKKFAVRIKPKTAELLYKLINDYCYEPGDSIFGFGVRRAEVLIGQETRRVIGRSLNPHAFRHGFVTYLLKKGFNIEQIKYLSRHEDIKTLGLYLHLDDKDLENKRKELGY